jgi:archaetidylinositol phosphate synthase
MGTQAQALGLGRAYGGILGRADRLVLLFVGGLIQLVFAPLGNVLVGADGLAFGHLEWFMVLFAVLGNITAIQRAVKIWRGLPH